MGWSNSVPIFHDDVGHILKAEIPDVALHYIDDVNIKGPATDYPNPDGTVQRIPQNPEVRRYFWEHLHDVNRCVQRVEFAHRTFSGPKTFIGPPEFHAVGNFCTPVGRKPDEKRTEAISNW
ncbi:hypothetical protein L227DRAFT_505031, partial [Lentinus tigrinus ALCF2SS1-6]